MNVQPSVTGCSASQKAVQRASGGEELLTPENCPSQTQFGARSHGSAGVRRRCRSVPVVVPSRCRSRITLQENSRHLPGADLARSHCGGHDMRSAAAVLVLLVLAAVPLGAQGRGRNRSQGIPPGHLPPPGECRVWYDGRPAGHQPPPTDCREAERVAARDRDARVIYGGDPNGRDNDRWSRDDDRSTRGRAIPRREASPYPYPDRSPYPDRYPYPDSYPDGRDGGYSPDRVPFDNGYRDGYEKGQEDAGDRDSYDPLRHRWYRSADRGYDRRDGSRDEYKNVYREGFRAGYEDGYGASSRYGRNTRRERRR